jgi:hypothetical protein
MTANLERERHDRSAGACQSNGANAYDRATDRESHSAVALPDERILNRMANAISIGTSSIWIPRICLSEYVDQFGACPMRAMLVRVSIDLPEVDEHVSRGELASVGAPNVVCRLYAILVDDIGHSFASQSFGRRRDLEVQVGYVWVS